MTRFNDALLKSWAEHRRPLDADKSQFGHVLVLGGDVGMWGAVYLAAKAALRMGAGLVSVLTHEAHAPFVSLNRPEIMSAAFQNESLRHAIAQRVSHVVVGPGLGDSAFSHAVCEFALSLKRPTLFDAGALRYLAQQRLTPEQAVITPHAGEAAYLLGCSKAEIESDRVAACIKLVQTYSAITVLKGHGTLVADAQTQPERCPWGNPYMASAGMGDALSGIIVGLMTQTSDFLNAAMVGVALHATAGDTLMQAGPHGFLAEDVIEQSVGCLNAYHTPH